jgi:hypothetical protein
MLLLLPSGPGSGGKYTAMWRTVVREAKNMQSQKYSQGIWEGVVEPSDFYNTLDSRSIFRAYSAVPSPTVKLT